jgi:uncharacterized membrane protein YsdA (DUF1294 family)
MLAIAATLMSKPLGKSKPVSSATALDYSGLAGGIGELLEAARRASARTVKDAKGRTCATNAVHVNDGGRITALSVLSLVCLLVLPVISLQRRAVDFRWVGAYMLVVSALAYGAYAVDKRRARAKERRLSETGLHLLELLGGWPGAFLAQRRLRHKCSKGSYQVMFWLIVLAYQFAAFDSLQNWQLSRAALARLEATSGHRR